MATDGENSSESFLLLSVTNDGQLAPGEAVAPPSQTQPPSQPPPPAPAAAAAGYYDAPPSSLPPPYSSVMTPYPQHEQPPAYTSHCSSSEQTGGPRLDLVPLLGVKRLQQVYVIGTEHYPQPTVSVNDEIWQHVSAADAIPDPAPTTSATTSIPAAYNGVYSRDLTTTSSTAAAAATTTTTTAGGNATTVTFVRRYKKSMSCCTAVCGICILMFYIFRFSLSLSRH